MCPSIRIGSTSSLSMVILNRCSVKCTYDLKLTSSSRVLLCLVRNLDRFISAPSMSELQAPVSMGIPALTKPAGAAAIPPVLPNSPSRGWGGEATLPNSPAKEWGDEATLPNSPAREWDDEPCHMQTHFSEPTPDDWHDIPNYPHFQHPLFRPGPPEERPNPYADAFGGIPPTGGPHWDQHKDRGASAQVLCSL
jgi:hypothetical protein